MLPAWDLSDTVLARLGTPRRATRLIAGLPIALWAVPFAVTLVLFGPLGVMFPPVLMAIGFHALWVLAQLYGAVRLRRNPLEAERYPRLLGWFLGIGAVFFAVNLAGTLTAPAFDPLQSLGWLAFSWNMGSGIGLLVGLVEARAIDRAVDAERAATEADLLAAQRDRFEYMNALIRHEVLNNVQVVRGQAEFLLDADPDPEIADGLAVISRQSEDMAEVVEDVRVITQGLGRTELEAVDLAAVLRAELTDLRDSHARLGTDLECPDGVRVRADGLLARVFGNLLSNAVEHNDADVPRVSVTVETDDETDAATVRVADNGPGVPEAVQRSMFDRSSGPHGVGLYLVDTLVTHYGGDVELTETGPDGTVFAVELRLASDAERTGTPARDATTEPGAVDGSAATDGPTATDEGAADGGTADGTDATDGADADDGADVPPDENRDGSPTPRSPLDAQASAGVDGED